tara:strand:- start:162 stop:830 length:669 start_codon:yes stop_codon:yes gene_type:complete
MTNKNKIVITGASSGLGESLYNSFSKSYDVINISRTVSKSNYNIIINLENLSELKKKLKFEKIEHDICILNAGTMGMLGLANKISDEDFFKSIKVNVLASKIIIDWSISNGCNFFIGISSGAAIKNYDGWLNYCVTKSAFRTMILQYQKDLPKLNFKLISPGILKTKMNKKIKELDVSLYPDMNKFHETIATHPKKASEIIYRKHIDYFKSSKLEIDLRNEL